MSLVAIAAVGRSFGSEGPTRTRPRTPYERRSLGAWTVASASPPDTVYADRADATTFDADRGTARHGTRSW